MEYLEILISANSNCLLILYRDDSDGRGLGIGGEIGVLPRGWKGHIFGRGGMDGLRTPPSIIVFRVIVWSGLGGTDRRKFARTPPPPPYLAFAKNKAKVVIDMICYQERR